MAQEQMIEIASTKIEMSSTRLKLPIKADPGEILDLRIDKSMDTLLDIQGYDRAHSVSKTLESSKRKWRTLSTIVKIAIDDYKSCLHQEVFTSNFKESVLELAAGTGNISLGIASDEQVKQVVISDISPGMLQICQQRLSCAQAKKYSLTLFDANKLPFEDSQFNLIVGNSVLHHLENFENTLRECKRVLKPGGACIFGEPILNSQSFMSLFCDLVLNISELKGDKLSKKEKLILSTISQKALTKRRHLEELNRSVLKKYEDKFQFPVEYMKTLCTNVIGFSSAQCCTPSNNKETSHEKMDSIRRNLHNVFAQCDENASLIIEKYEFILESIRKTCFEPLADETYSAFQYFVMIK